jgi:hypothetical protein
VWLPKSDGWRVDDEELPTPDNVGNADVLLKGVDVSVSEDADKVDDNVSDSVEVVDDGEPSTGSGSSPGRDTLGNTSLSAGKPAVRPAGKPTAVGATGESKVKVSMLVTAPVASM